LGASSSLYLLGGHSAKADPELTTTPSFASYRSCFPPSFLLGGTGHPQAPLASPSPGTQGNRLSSVPLFFDFPLRRSRSPSLVGKPSPGHPALLLCPPLGMGAPRSLETSSSWSFTGSVPPSPPPGPLSTPPLRTADAPSPLLPPVSPSSLPPFGGLGVGELCRCHPALLSSLGGLLLLLRPSPLGGVGRPTLGHPAPLRCPPELVALPISRGRVTISFPGPCLPLRLLIGGGGFGIDYGGGARKGTVPFSQSPVVLPCSSLPSLLFPCPPI
jgi:hypothetical protein